MSRKIFTLSAMLALATCLALAQDQPAQSQQPTQPQAMPQTQQAPQAQRAPGQGQTGMSSQQLEAAFQRTFQHYPQLSNVSAKVADDKIELSGTVPSQADKDRLHRMAEENAGGRKVVDDNLKVSGSDQQANPPMSEKPPMSQKPPMSEQPPVPQKPPVLPR